MKITKIGHCCLVVEIDGVKIMTDPGAWSSGQENVTGLNAVLITHEHLDHLHTESLQQILANNAGVRIITNKSVGKILDGLNVKYEIVSKKLEVKGISLESFDAKHEEIFGEIGQVENTAFLIGDKLLYPGDSFHNPGRKIDVLALPVAGPWCRIKDVINYALEMKPKSTFPVHDGMLQLDKIGPFHRLPSQVLTENNIEFVAMNPGDIKEF